MKNGIGIIQPIRPANGTLVRATAQAKSRAKNSAIASREAEKITLLSMIGNSSQEPNHTA